MIAYRVLIFCLAVGTCLSMDGQTKNPPITYGCGVPGIPGRHGLPGRDGREGQRGSQGVKGDKCDSGKGVQGPQGPQGKPGSRGEKGQKGEAGVFRGQGTSVNRKQCVWKKNDNRASGVIYDCSFTKRKSGSSLKVTYAAVVRVRSTATECCGRWYFKFNGRECSSPMAIDGLVYVYDSNSKSNYLNLHRSIVIEGFCDNLPAGKISVAVHVGNCHGIGGTAERYSGWNSVSRIMIEE
eukprot:m.30637 g.30637  ORF g.30637 m.30637 type:complete len:238 (+) comp31370_c0_seq2:387-1100(+)